MKIKIRSMSIEYSPARGRKQKSQNTRKGFFFIKIKGKCFRKDRGYGTT